ncbi:MAG: hypothetical protein ACR2P0_18215 [Acidimicrobiales bacterium]
MTESQTGAGMQILAALYIDDIDLRPVDGPSTRIDLGGVQFSAAAPSEDAFAWAPHLVVIVRGPDDADGNGVLETKFLMDGEQAARSVQPFGVEQGRFGYRLVRAEIEVTAPTSVEAHVRLDDGPVMVVPFNHLPPASD